MIVWRQLHDDVSVTSMRRQIYDNVSVTSCDVKWKWIVMNFQIMINFHEQFSFRFEYEI